jgi:alkylation response protein AidB-like acyl-CoA dehydrogenase
MATAAPTSTATRDPADPSTIERQLLAAVAELEPGLRSGGQAAEAARDLGAATVAGLRERGFFRIWRPRALGGMELHPTAALRVFEALARVESAAAWVVSNSAVITSFFQVFCDDGLDEIFAEPDTIVAGGWFPPGIAVPVDGGYRITGRWTFGSGCTHADWLTGMTVILDASGQPELGPDGTPRLLLFAVPAGEATVVEHWDTLGMRGTGSHDTAVSDVFVPATRTFAVGPFTSPGTAFAGPLYRFHMWLGGPEIAAVGLGVADAAVDRFLELIGHKAPSYTAQLLGDRPVVHDQLARAAALVGAGRAYLHRAVDDAFTAFEAGAAPDPLRLAPVQLASSFAAEAAAQAVDLLHRAAGTSAIRVEDGLERHFRDVHTISQHTLASAARYESVGQLLAGRQSDWTFFYL